jgi:hypothetical protein
MTKIIPISLGAALWLCACGSNRPDLAERGHNEALHLQEYCKRAGINNAETQRADAYLADAAKSLKDGEGEKAADQSDLASSQYRLALARKDLAGNQAQVDSLKSGLAKDKDQLQTYQEILGEMKTVRKP